MMNTIKSLILDFKIFYRECRAEDFGFYMVAAYIIFSYLRPQVIFPALDIIPWTQISIIAGLVFAATKRTLKFQLPHFAVLLFFCVILLSSYNSTYPEISFSKIDIVPIWLLEIIFFTSCINSIRKFRLITILFFLVLFKISFFGARTWIQRGFGFRDYGISGPSGYFHNSGELSLLMAMVAVMSLALLIGNKDTRKIFLLLPITAYMTVMAASSRGGQLALLAGSLLFFAAKGSLKLKYIMLAIALTFSAYTILPEEQKARFTSAGSDTTSQARLVYWSKGMEMLADYPALGVGYRCFSKYFNDYYSDDIPDEIALRNRREEAHNTFIQVSSEMGLLGLASYLWICLIVFKINKNSRKLIRKSSKAPKEIWLYQYSIGLDIAQIVFFIGASFMSVSLYPYNYFMIMFSLSINNIIKQTIVNQEKTGSVNSEFLGEEGNARG